MTRARDVANLIGSGNYSSTTFTATAGQTVFSIAHTQNFVQVFMNGLLLDLTVDYTSNGSAVTLTSGAAAGDEIEVVAYNTFSVGDALNQAAADTRYVNTAGDTMTGDLTVDTNTFHVDVADNRVGIGTSTPDMGKLQINEDAAASTAIFIRNRHNVAGTYSDITFGYGEASNSYGAGIRFRQVDTTHGGQIELYTDNASGAYTKQMEITENGHVTKPNQPMIAGTMGTAQTHPTNDTLLSFNVFFVNRGITFNSSTKRFTVPTAGVYSIMLTPFVFGGSHGPHRVLVGLNTDTPTVTTHKGHFYTNQDHYDSGALHSVVDLAANDYIVFRLSNGKLYNQSSDRFNEFSICKIA